MKYAADRFDDTYSHGADHFHDYDRSIYEPSPSCGAEGVAIAMHVLDAPTVDTSISGERFPDKLSLDLLLSPSELEELR